MGPAATLRQGAVDRSIGELVESPGNLELASRARVPRYLPIACLLVIILAGGALRMFSLDSWPVFNDEDGYTQAAIAARGLSLREAVKVSSRLTTKPPLPFLFQGSLIRAGLDPVVAGRLMSAAAGTATTALCFLLGRRMSGTAVGVIAAAAYAVSPIALLHERMVLQDGALSAFALGALLAAWRAVDRASLQFGALGGMLGAAAVQVKLPGVASALFPVLLFALAGQPWRPRVVPTLLAATGPLLSYGALIWGPVGANIQEQNTQLLSPFTFIPQNLQSLSDAVDSYFPAGLVFLIVVGVIIGLLFNAQRTLVPIIAILIWILPWIVLSKFSPPRYFLPALPYVCVIACLGPHRLIRPTEMGGKMRAVPVLAGVAVLTYWIGTSGVDAVRLVGDYASARMSGFDDCQYRSCWPAGFGYEDAARFISAAAQPGDRVAYFIDHGHLVAAGFFAPLPEGVKSLGMLAVDSRLVAGGGRVLAMVDDGRDEPAGTNLRQLLALHPGWKVVAQFPRPRSDRVVMVLDSGSG